MRAILSAPGSRGDVNPMVAIGRALKQRGMDVIISLAEPYAPVAEAAGLTAVPIITTARFEHLLGDANVWKPVRGARAIFREVAGNFLTKHFDVIRQNHIAGQTVLVSHPLDLASRVHRDWDPATPLVDVHLAPSMLRTLDDPPRMTPWAIEHFGPQWLLRAAYWAADRFVIDPVIAGRVNQMRKDLRLAPVTRLIDQWWLSPDRILAMYPDWYAAATKSFGPRLMHCGFPLDDAVVDSAADRTAQVLPSDRPIVFTAGTAHQHCREFFADAVAACLAIDRPGWLVSSYPGNFPDQLPPSIQAHSYVSFGELFPHASAVVHHGGIGTTSQALAAGVPQLIQPMAFDQFDNTNRVQRLNCGRWLRRPRHLAAALQQLLDDESIQRSCRLVADSMERGSPTVAACEIHRLLCSTGSDGRLK
ncbi:MurG-like transferase [Rubripirellula lacrimiformis]|uniref:MurG-like transferase n=1 Tax=Rubripirellula lacrimiformis TaxID=1930273 RepID=A0A517N7W2_9BACT|nr:nucleotide disphospho-sugar-binding domain-containing protein [Rubripirellula lacrimiformis]QDT03234.1 MurG-like transferase [Rubripirellula lacrimiformis]